MRTMLTMVLTLGLLSLLSAGCGGDDFECSIGQLSGSWRMSYAERDGDCGAISDETVLLTPGDQFNGAVISADRCEADMQFTAPTTDNEGTQAWTIHLDQTGEESLDGTGTVQVNHPTLGTCRSTYDLSMRRL